MTAWEKVFSFEFSEYKNDSSDYRISKRAKTKQKGFSLSATAQYIKSKHLIVLLGPGRRYSLANSYAD